MKTCVITGTSRRFGLLLTEEFSKAGWQVIAITRTISNELVQLSKKFSHLRIQQWNYDDLDSLRQQATDIATEQPIDLLINNASYFKKDEELADRIQDHRAFFNVHMALPAILVESFFHQRSHPANIINITDIYVDRPNPDYSLYCSTKAGLDNLTKSWAMSLAPSVRVNSIQPGPVKFLPEHSGSDIEAVNDETLLTTDDGFWPLYQGVQSLLENNFMTGCALKIDGGRSLGKPAAKKA